MNIQHRRERYFEEDIWVMDSECCERCGCILDAFHDEEAAMYAGWCWDDEEGVPPTTK